VVDGAIPASGAAEVTDAAETAEGANAGVGAGEAEGAGEGAGEDAGSPEGVTNVCHRAAGSAGSVRWRWNTRQVASGACSAAPLTERQDEPVEPASATAGGEGGSISARLGSIAVSSGS